VPVGRDTQQPFEPPALLGGERRGEHRPAALIGALARGTDVSPERAPPGQQDPSSDQELAGTREQRAAALRGHPRAGS
jgi:hypothetical protein